MTEARIPRGPDLSLYARTDGATDATAPTVVLAHGLGIDHRLWDGVVAHLPRSLRVARWDGRGHGRSGMPPGPCKMGHLVSDAEAVCDFLGVRDAVVVGLSMGGLVAQGLAVKRLDLVRGLVLSNTAARIATPAIWAERAAAVRAGGIAAILPAAEARWWSRDAVARGLPAQWRPVLMDCDTEGYAANCEAIGGADFYTPTSGLRLPTLGLAGAEDGSTPPDLVRETVDLIPGSRFHLFRRQGHLPCLEDPAGYAAVLTAFLQEIGHIR